MVFLMSPKNRNVPSQSINVSNVQHVPGTMNIAGGDITTHESISIHHDANAGIVAKALAEALEKTRKRPKTTRARKTDIEKEVKEIETELAKKKADKGFLAERFRNIAKIAPDILDVIIASLGNPAAGIGLAVKKIAEKAKAEAEKEAGNP